MRPLERRAGQVRNTGGLGSFTSSMLLSGLFCEHHSLGQHAVLTGISFCQHCVLNYCRAVLLKKNLFLNVN